MIRQESRNPDCPAEERLAAYASGALQPDEVTAIEDHLGHCAACRSWLECDIQAHAWLREMGEVARAAAKAEPPQPVAPTAAPAGSAVPPSDQTDRAVLLPAIPGFHITRELGRGGQGIVYEARQLSTRRKVAIKLLFHGPNAPTTAIKRFEREVVLVAQLNHPNIVAVFQSGILENDLPYCVMEYVEGVPLHYYVREHKLSLEQTMDLFAVVCGAVQYAHQRGVIHRDLKPSNILVQADGQPKVLDFGLAKSLVDLETSTLVSGSGEILGTLAYMSPEQVSGRPEQVDVRSDTYALGVILYELLTGTHPYAVVGSVADVIHQIAEGQPIPPDRAWKPGSGVTHGGSRPRRTPECPIDTDLQTILLKALAKDPDRRYQTTDQLRSDIRRHLAHEPIEARSDSRWYLLRKSLRRYRMATTFMALLLLVATIGFVAVTHFWREALRQTRLARAEARAKQVSHELIPPDMARLPDHLENLKLLHLAVGEDAFDEFPDLLSDSIRLEEQGLLEDVEHALATNSLAELADLFLRDASQPTLAQVLRESAERHPDNGLLDRLRSRLECWIRVPPPIGRGQEMHDCLKMLLKLDPQSPRAKRLEMQSVAMLGALPTVHREEFTGYPAGHVVDSWEQHAGVERCDIVQPDRGMRISSTASTSGTARLILDPAVVDQTGHVNVLCWTFHIDAGDSETISSCSASIALIGTGGRICKVGLMDGHFEHRIRDGSGEWLVARREPVERNRTYHAELRYFRERGTYDFLIDGDYLVEEAPCENQGPITAIWAGASHGAEMILSRLELRAGDSAMKADLGPHVPVITEARIPLDAVRHIPMPCIAPMVYDFNCDGNPELVTGCINSCGLVFARLHGPHFDCEVLSETRLDGFELLLPCGIVDRRLAVSCIGPPIANVDSPRTGFALLGIEHDLSTTKVFSRVYDQPGRAWVTPLGPEGTAGFAVGLHEPARAIEIFDPVQSGPGDPYVRRFRLTPHKPGERLASDVHSVLPIAYDDGGGVSRLAIGWGHWHGYCAAVVDLPPLATHQGLGSAAVAQDDVDRLWIPAFPLTGRVGVTHLARSELGTGIPHLIAASRKTRLEPKNGAGPPYTTDFGVRVWPIAADFGRTDADPVFFEPSNVVAVAAGELCGQEVFATASLEIDETFGTTNLAIQVYGMIESEIVKLWRAVFHDTTWESLDLHISDANGDGTQDLLIALRGSGLMICSAE